METFIFDPLVPPPILAALWAAAVALCVGYAIWRPARLSAPRRFLFAALHFVPLVAILVLLHRPTWVRISGEGGAKPVLSVQVDLSASMATEDMNGPQGLYSRHAAVVEMVNENWKVWNHDFDVRLHGFDKAARAISDVNALGSATPTGNDTDIAASVDSSLSAQPRAALALLFSDGIHNVSQSDLPNAARTARASELPVFTCALGSNITVRDIGISLSSSEELAFIRQRVRIPVTVTQSGFDHQELEVELRESGKTIEKKKVRFEVGARETTLEFMLSRETAWLFTFDVSVPVQKGEALATNNRRRFALRVVNERISILLLEGKPYWDSKFLTRLLQRDPNVLLTTATMMRSDRVVIESPSAGSADIPSAGTLVAGGTPALPTWLGPRDPSKPLEDRKFLSQFQVLMLGREADIFLTESALQNLRDWISRDGGHLICTRGRPVSEAALSPSLATILPVAWKSDSEKHFGMKLTEQGRALALIEAGVETQPESLAVDPNVILKSLPLLVTATAIDKERSFTVVLARTADEASAHPMAVLSLQAYGLGKSVVLEGQGMWHWAFQSSKEKTAGDSEAVYKSFWTNMIRWLVGSHEFLPSQEFSIRAGKPLYQSGEAVVLYVLKREKSGDTGTPQQEATLPQIDVIREMDTDDNFSSSTTKESPRRIMAQPIPRDSQMLSVELNALEEGHYRARLVMATPNGGAAPPETAFEVLPSLKEKLDLRARPEALEQLSRMTDARSLGRADLSKLGEFYRDFIRHHRPASEIKRPAWDQAWVLALLMIWLGATWWVRRKWGCI